jgi:hypothetical protein
VRQIRVNSEYDSACFAARRLRISNSKKAGRRLPVGLDDFDASPHGFGALTLRCSSAFDARPAAL